MNDDDRVLAESRGGRWIRIGNRLVWQVVREPNDMVVIAGKGLGIRFTADRSIFSDGPAGRPFEVLWRYQRRRRHRRIELTEDQLRWLVETGGPAALITLERGRAALDQPAPATEGPEQQSELARFVDALIEALPPEERAAYKAACDAIRARRAVDQPDPTTEGPTP